MTKNVDTREILRRTIRDGSVVFNTLFVVIHFMIGPLLWITLIELRYNFKVHLSFDLLITNYLFLLPYSTVIILFYLLSLSFKIKYSLLCTIVFSTFGPLIIFSLLFFGLSEAKIPTFTEIIPEVISFIVAWPLFVTTGSAILAMGIYIALPAGR